MRNLVLGLVLFIAPIHALRGYRKSTAHGQKGYGQPAGEPVRGQAILNGKLIKKSWKKGKKNK